MNPQVDKYLIDGCMRCKYGGTSLCKVNSWRTAIELLRQIVLETGLKEEIKWGSPVYTHLGKNIVSVGVLKDGAIMGFFKGALLSDTHKMLQQQGNVQSGRIIKFTREEDIERVQEVLKAYIHEAIGIEESGMKVAIKARPEPIPDELQQAFESDPVFKKAFYNLTPGRQRGYIIHFSQPKQAQTRRGRIEKLKNQILNGIGLHDQYKSR
ncbi:hypothetical protein EL17_21875 [Anditalea andensis]|uniref:YdhG-like domain-containing protein n=2 Tax=Anditalea andensis TaxID=1048983 RepID=A0A074LP50_9BACT|nr:hypothetical protein EL17_21875 [Anditalea andensis]